MHRACHQRMNWRKREACRDFECVQNIELLSIESSGVGRLRKSDVADKQLSRFGHGKR